MDAIRCIKKRRSIRHYTEKAIPKDILIDIIDSARLAPSARNLQPWNFITVTEKDKLLRISEIATYGSFIKDAAACIVVCGDKGNRHLVEDGCAATQNMLLAACNYGIGSCWVAGWKRIYNPELMELLGIPESQEPVSIVSLGYPKEEPQAKNKKAIEEVLHWERF